MYNAVCVFNFLSRFLSSSTGRGYSTLDGFLLGTTCVSRYFPYSPPSMPPVNCYIAQD